MWNLGGFVKAALVAAIGLVSVICLVGRVASTAAASEAAQSRRSVSSSFCCPYYGAGNLDCSGDRLVTMGDLTVLIDHLFVSFTPLACPEAGNLDQGPDGLVTMGDLTVLVDHLFISFAPLPECPDTPGNPWGEFAGGSECKQLPGMNKDGDSTDFSCVEWEYTLDGTLRLTHVNAVFNCCPVLAANVYASSTTIYIVELDSIDGEGCPCMCCFDMDYEITNLVPGTYRVYIEEPYLYPQNGTVIDFYVNLYETPQGSHCLPRTGYPWEEM